MWWGVDKTSKQSQTAAQTNKLSNSRAFAYGTKYKKILSVEQLCNYFAHLMYQRFYEALFNRIVCADYSQKRLQLAYAGHVKKLELPL